MFKNICAVCHRLFDEGGQIGPDLTHANRKDQSFLLASIVDPSAVVRKEFLNYNVETTDGRFLSGLIGEQSPNSVTILMNGGGSFPASLASASAAGSKPIALVVGDANGDGALDIIAIGVNATLTVLISSSRQ